MPLTDIKYVGNGLGDEGYAGTICQRHNYRDIARFAYQLEEYECPTCVAEADREEQERRNRHELLANLGHPSICLCNVCAPWEAEYDRMDAEEAARLFVAEIKSPNYCDHYESPMGFPCGSRYCRHATCKIDLDQEPPF